jgi:hypothetical protein
MSLSRVLKQPRQWVYEDVLEEEAIQIELIQSEVEMIKEVPLFEPESIVESLTPSPIPVEVDMEAIRAGAIEIARQELYLENIAFVERMQMEYKQFLQSLTLEQNEVLNALKAQAHHLALACTEKLIHSKANDEDQTQLLKLIESECERHKDEHFTRIHLSRTLKPFEHELETILNQNQLNVSWVEGSKDTCVFEKEGTFYDVSLTTKLENLKHLFMTR